MGTNTQKIIQSVKLHISHQMNPYSNVMTIWVSIYTCLPGFAELRQVREIRPQNPKNIVTDTQKDIQTLKFHIAYQM